MGEEHSVVLLENVPARRRWGFHKADAQIVKFSPAPIYSQELSSITVEMGMNPLPRAIVWVEKVTSIPTHRPHRSVQAACHRCPVALLAKSAVELKLQAKWNKQRGSGTLGELSKKPERDGKSVLKQTPTRSKYPSVRIYAPRLL